MRDGTDILPRAAIDGPAAGWAERVAPGVGEPRQGGVLSISKRGFHRLAYAEWGEADAARVTLCAHGLTRQGRDFDMLAAELAARGGRVLCPDLPGRGRSGRLLDPFEYVLPQYCVDMTAVLAASGAASVDWVGTSLGGLIGILLAGQPNSPIRRLVINDIGPFVPWSALYRIGSYVRAKPESFPDYEAAEQYHRRTLAPFGALTDAQWRHITEHGVGRTPDGRYHLLTDPGIGHAFQPGLLYNLNIWSYWDNIRCPVLVMRGAESDLLLRSTAEEMTRRGPGAELVELPGIGHAPALLDEAQVSLVADWLDRDR